MKTVREVALYHERVLSKYAIFGRNPDYMKYYLKRVMRVLSRVQRGKETTTELTELIDEVDFSSLF
jgi:hypothetical protein